MNRARARAGHTQFRIRITIPVTIILCTSIRCSSCTVQSTEPTECRQSRSCRESGNRNTTAPHPAHRRFENPNPNHYQPRLQLHPHQPQFHQHVDLNHDQFRRLCHPLRPQPHQIPLAASTRKSVRATHTRHRKRHHTDLMIFPSWPVCLPPNASKTRHVRHEHHDGPLQPAMARNGHETTTNDQSRERGTENGNERSSQSPVFSSDIPFSNTDECSLAQAQSRRMKISGQNTQSDLCECGATTAFNGIANLPMDASIATFQHGLSCVGMTRTAQQDPLQDAKTAILRLFLFRQRGSW